MTPKLTLSITTIVGLFFSLGMFFAPEFVTKEQFPNSEGQGFITNLLLHTSGKISAIPPIVGTGFIAILSLFTLLNLRKNYWISRIDLWHIYGLVIPIG